MLVVILMYLGLQTAVSLYTLEQLYNTVDHQNYLLSTLLAIIFYLCAHLISVIHLLSSQVILSKYYLKNRLQ